MKTFVVKITRLDGAVNHGRGNGYVLIPQGHQFHGMEYSNIDDYVDVHAGLTFAEMVDEKMIKIGRRIFRNSVSCSGKWEGLIEDDIGGWLVGFDTAHYCDNMTNRSKEDVIKETERLKEQIENYI